MLFHKIKILYIALFLFDCICLYLYYLLYTDYNYLQSLPTPVKFINYSLMLYFIYINIILFLNYALYKQYGKKGFEKETFIGSFCLASIAVFGISFIVATIHSAS